MQAHPPWVACDVGQMSFVLFLAMPQAEQEGSLVYKRGWGVPVRKWIDCPRCVSSMNDTNMRNGRIRHGR